MTEWNLPWLAGADNIFYLKHKNMLMLSSDHSLYSEDSALWVKHEETTFVLYVLEYALYAAIRKLYTLLYYSSL